MKNSKNLIIISVFLFALITFSGCKKDETTDVPFTSYSVKTSDLTAIFSLSTPNPSSQEGSFTYSWDFGDGATSTDKAPAHTYAYAGQYDVNLTVDNAGSTTKYTYHVTVPSATGSFISTAGLAVTAIAIDGSDIYAGTDSDAVYVSGNSGASWTQIDSGFHSPVSIHSLLSDAGKIYAGTDSGVYVLNMGTTPYWTRLGISSSRVIGIITDGTNLVAGTSSGVYTSTDNGATWTQTRSGLIRSIEGDGSEMIVHTFNFIYLSTDGGLTWNQANGDLPGGLVIQSSGVVDSTLLTSENSTLYISRDLGLTWNQDTIAFNNPVQVNSYTTVGSRIYAATSSGVYVTTNYGMTRWALMALLGNNCISIRIIGSDIYVLTNQGIYVGTF